MCLFPTYDNNKTYLDSSGNRLNDEEEWIDYYRDELQLARFERIFIGIGIFAILLGTIISIWRKYDPEFQNLHKPALNENDHEMSRIESSSDEESIQVSEDQLEKEQC